MNDLSKFAIPMKMEKLTFRPRLEDLFTTLLFFPFRVRFAFKDGFGSVYGVRTYLLGIRSIVFLVRCFLPTSDILELASLDERDFSLCCGWFSSRFTA
jgi:hypothetical protein